MTRIRSWPSSVSPTGPIAGGRTPRKFGWFSGKPRRTPPVAGEAQTGRRWRSARAIAAVPAAGGVDVGAGDEDRVARRVELGGERRHRGRVGDGAAGHLAGRRVAGVGGVDLDLPVVHRQADEDRAARREAGEVGAVGERQRHVLGPRRLVAPLDQRVRHAGRVAVGEVGLQGDLGARLLARGDQQRRVVGLRVEDRPHRVAHPRRGVEVDDGGAAARLGEAVGHPDHDRLLQPEHVTEVAREVTQHRQLGRARVAEHRRHPLLPEQLERRLAHGRHRRHVTRIGVEIFGRCVAELTSLTP